MDRERPAEWPAAACKVCTSPRRALVESWLANGMSVRVISRNLAVLGERISRATVWVHKKHFPIHAGAAIEYQAAVERIDAPGEYGLPAAVEPVSELQIIDEIMLRARSLHAQVYAQLAELTGKRQRIPPALVSLYSATASEIRHQARAKAELLGNDPESQKAAALESWLDLVVGAYAASPRLDREVQENGEIAGSIDPGPA